jgi:mannose-6-phosphate isomerase-like protein (cupin superfamily)
MPNRSSSLTETPAPSILIIAPEAGRPLTAFGSTAVFKLNGEQTGGTLCLGLARTPPGVGPPAHVHRRDDELFVVVEGTLSFWTAAGWRQVTPGTVIYVPRGAPHAFRNTGTTPSSHWVLTLPSGFEEFYARAAALFAAGGGAPDPQQLRGLAGEYGYEFLPPGSAPAPEAAPPP